MSDDDSSNFKKRRLQNACDECRKKKIKCDSAVRLGNICSNCSSSKAECTHQMAMARKKSGPRIGQPRGQRSIQATVEAILSTRRLFEVPKDSVKVKQILVDLANRIKELEEEIARLRLQAGSASAGSMFSSTSLAGTEDTFTGDTTQQMTASQDSRPIQVVFPYSIDNLTKDLKMFEFDDTTVRHFGSSSSITLVRATIDVKKQSGYSPLLENGTKRPEFWTTSPWQIPPSKDPPAFKFPPEDLMEDLLYLYFTNQHQIMPVVHRPSFLKSLAEGLHYKDPHFGGLVLAMCSMGARFSDDPRVYEENTTSEKSIGWKYIRQIRPLERSFFEPPSIYDLQMYAIYISFMGTTTTPEVCWILIGVAVRLLQDVGAHRKQRNSQASVETESWKRAFWVLYTMDILASTFLGRPRSMSQDDFDLDLPLECDDEYWEHTDPQLAFQQPPGKPSTMSYWICFMKLMNIMESVLRTIYAVKQSDVWSAMGLSKTEWNQKKVAELDSLLNKWTDEIPEHLKWDPKRENAEHLQQSALLHTSYYWIQIVVHRPFIPKPGESSLLNFPSLAICTSAARTSIRIMEILHQQNETSLIVMPNVTMTWLNSALIMLVNLWRGRHLGSSSINLEKGLAEVYKVLDTFHLHENRWTLAGRFADILGEVISVSQFQPEARSSLKRPRNPDTNNVSDTYSRDDGVLGHRQIAGSNRVSAALELESVSSLPEPYNAFKLPLQSSELGSIPLYEHSDWSTTHNQWVPSASDPLDQSQLNAMSEYEVFSSGGHPLPLEFLSREPESRNIQDSGSVLDDPADWTSYMASIDEVLQTLNPRGSGYNS
ncbi:hypothetical protein BT96DRAFT_869308 [Gymnopus androsaceus JB14]|uniref:Zn(2)-C6 fungal-type domain-containing protein n=1 Tax=Gymnopus androsaceus JB14 TaxID=1447944 RepID=A0A6A4GCR6_9AGAR|nr:hypothetical protein BT96DRAFT_869308 [Gymnopus androsaceus JB14]